MHKKRTLVANSMRFKLVLIVALASLNLTGAAKPNASAKAPSPAKATSKAAVAPPKPPQPTLTKPPTSPFLTATKSGLSLASTSSAAASSSACFYQNYVPTFDAGPDEDSETRRSIAGRIEVEKRASGRKPPSAFGICEFQSKVGKALEMRSNPTIDNVLTNINQAGGIPKWFQVKKDCSAAPGLEKIALAPNQAKSKIKVTNPHTGKTVEQSTYNVDHIWELKFMTLFFESILPKNEKSSATLTCKDFDVSFIMPGSKPADQPIQQLYARMPQALIGKKSTMDTLEFAGTSVQLNAKKGRILTPRADKTSLSSTAHGFTMRNTKDRIESLRTVGTAFDFMNNPEISTLFNRAQTRLKAYLSEVDSRLAASSVKLSRADFKWATQFENWMKTFLDVSCDDAYDWIDSMTKQVQQEITKMPEKTPAEKADKVVHLTYLNSFTRSKYSKKAHYKLDWKA